MRKTERFPNLYLAGAPKCGTTSLANWLGQHPDIYAPLEKEPIIFGADLTSQHPRDPVARTAEHFGAWDKERYALDATTHYFYSQTAPDQIAAACDDARIYILVRNPAEAVHSMYHQNRFNGTETLPTLEQSLDAEATRAASLQPIRFGFPEKLLYSRIFAYSKNILRFEQLFGFSRVRVILFDDLVAKPFHVTRSIFRDLEIDEAFAERLEFVAKNSAKSVRSRWIHSLAVYPPHWAGALSSSFASKATRRKIRQWMNSKNTSFGSNPPLERATRQRLNEQFQPDVEWLSNYLKRDLSHWLHDD